MRGILFLCLFISSVLYSQNATLAKNYFQKGDYKKALIEYKKLHAKSSSNINYINQVINTYQQLEQYDAAQDFILKKIKRINYPALIVELGYNYQLKNDLKKANDYYQKAILKIDERTSYVFFIARSFQNHSLLKEAAASYEKATLLNPELDFNIELARIYGEQGAIEKMFNSYINFAESNPISINNVKRSINDFINEDRYNANNILFRKILLKRNQEKPNIVWNELLSWLFIQQKDFKKAFIQEKAIYKRQPETLIKLEELAIIALNENQKEIARAILNYIIETAKDTETKLDAYQNLFQIEIKESSKSEYKTIKEKYENLLKTFGQQPETLKIQRSYAHFLAFYLNQTEEATLFLQTTLKLPLTKIEKAQVKLDLGDILVLQEKFNQALIYYTQIQRNLKNSTISQEARFKVAKASYYKGDFKWAESQLKILKASTSQLIANDALDLKLLITDNKHEDSLQTALRHYAKADLLAFQNRNDEAISLLDKILNEHKTEPIIAQVLYKQAQLFELKAKHEKAKTNYEFIIENYKNSILIDDALFNLAELYKKQLNIPDKAKALYEQIIFNHANSIYFVEARKKYRTLRGDVIN